MFCDRRLETKGANAAAKFVTESSEFSNEFRSSITGCGARSGCWRQWRSFSLAGHIGCAVWWNAPKPTAVPALAVPEAAEPARFVRQVEWT
jgi:hypothetical protein